MNYLYAKWSIKKPNSYLTQTFWFWLAEISISKVYKSINNFHFERHTFIDNFVI